MSIPLFPSLRPNISSPFWLDVDSPIDEEAELLELERAQRDWKANLGRVFSSVLPIGKTSHGVDEEDLDDLADDEDDTTSSDEMDDDDGVDEFQLPDSQVPVQAPSTPEIADMPVSDVETIPADSLETPLTLYGAEEMQSESETSSAHDSASRTSARPSRMIVGRLIPAPRPGMSQQGTRAAFIDTAGRPVYSGRTSTGSVSPTSRAYIQAALHSPTGPVHLDLPDADDDTGNEVPDRTASPPHGTHGECLSYDPQHQQVVAAGQSIHPSESSTQIDNLIETMHQAQRAHAARVASPEERVSALLEAGTSNVTLSIEGTDEDSSIHSVEDL